MGVQNSKISDCGYSRLLHRPQLIRNWILIHHNRCLMKSILNFHFYVVIIKLLPSAIAISKRSEKQETRKHRLSRLTQRASDEQWWTANWTRWSRTWNYFGHNRLWFTRRTFGHRLANMFVIFLRSRTSLMAPLWRIAMPGCIATRSTLPLTCPTSMPPCKILT